MDFGSLSGPALLHSISDPAWEIYFHPVLIFCLGRWVQKAACFSTFLGVYGVTDFRNTLRGNADLAVASHGEMRLWGTLLLEEHHVCSREGQLSNVFFGLAETLVCVIDYILLQAEAFCPFCKSS